MKKIVALALISATPVIQADILFTVKAGANLWHAETTGQVDGTQLDESGLNIDTESQMNGYVSFEHPVPFFPNIKVAHTGLALEGTGEAGFTFDGTDFAADAETKLDLTHMDLTLYWGIPLPLPYLDINFGFTGRNFTGGAEVKGLEGGVTTGGVSSVEQKQKIDFNQVIPMAYGNVQLGDFFGVYGYAEIHYIGFDDNTLSDMTVALGYTLPIPVVDVNLEVGHRQMNLETDIDDFTSDVEVGGMFGGISLALGF